MYLFSARLGKETPITPGYNVLTTELSDRTTHYILLGQLRIWKIAPDET